jgi:hypothetical protein
MRQLCASMPSQRARWGDMRARRRYGADMKARVIILGRLTVGACGSKRDCDASTRHYASLRESTRASTLDIARDMRGNAPAVSGDKEFSGNA